MEKRTTILSEGAVADGCGKSLNRDDSPPQGLKPSLVLHDLRGAKAPLYHSAAGFRDFFRSLLGARRLRWSCPEPSLRPRLVSRRTGRRAPGRLVPRSCGPFVGYPFRKRRPPPRSLLHEQTPLQSHDRCRLPLLSQMPLFPSRFHSLESP